MPVVEQKQEKPGKSVKQDEPQKEYKTDSKEQVQDITLPELGKHGKGKAQIVKPNEKPLNQIPPTKEKPKFPQKPNKPFGQKPKPSQKPEKPFRMEKPEKPFKKEKPMPPRKPQKPGMKPKETPKKPQFKSGGLNLRDTWRNPKNKNVNSENLD